MLARKSFLDTLGWEDGGGLGVEEEVVVVGGVRLLKLGEGAWARGCCEVDGCWVGVFLRLCTLGGGLTDTLGEDTVDVCMVVGVVSAREWCVVMGVLVMEVVAEDVVHAGVSGDETGREEEDVEEGDTVEAVDVGVSAWGWCLCACGMCGTYVCHVHSCVLMSVHAGLKVPFLQEDGPDAGLVAAVAAVEPVDSEEEEAEEEDIDNRNNIIMQNFQ
ncbi:hypothetical protein NDU88_006609 [Pleurodeles waltl]|uniref:Uncharacterized protein n=1 Tax=Pleurodeles waltl TaxID=8319 RepID=A0AAV7WB28_PLEWA|nr:hypothetical protein NDU88_006609 [Pleurodeles waltl]